MIEIRDLRAAYGGLEVLRGITLDVARGSCTAVVGRSGVGKSTLLRLVIALEHPAAGRVRVGGVDVGSAGEAELDALKRRMSMLFQSSALLDSMSVFDNVALPLREHGGVDERTVRETVEEKLALVQLEEAAPKLPRQLSGGMRKRAALARAIAIEPEYLLCDEPTGGLDPVTGRRIAEMLDDQRRRLGTTSIVVTHDMACVARVADRVCLLEEGRIVFDDTTEHFMHTEEPAVRAYTADTESRGIEVAS